MAKVKIKRVDIKSLLSNTKPKAEVTYVDSKSSISYTNPQSLTAYKDAKLSVNFVDPNVVTTYVNAQGTNIHLDTQSPDKWFYHSTAVILSLIHI